jgi:alpha-galactosidase
VSDHAREKGTKTIVWFEPERVSAGTWLWDNKPEWILKSSSFAESWGRLLNLGNPDARKWVTERVDALIKSEGIDLYRQDYNIRPLSFWRDNDAPDRQGITENLYVQGYLAFWDELRKRHPDMLIDTCASGGTRNDLETLRRAVPLLRSDCILEPIGQQNHTYGISFWIPFYGTGLKYSDSYQLRSSMCPVQISCCDVRDTTLDYPALRSYFQQFREVAPNFYGDYYPLTAYRPELDVWMAWQFDRSEEGRGMVEAFRRPESVFEVARLKLRGLDPAATYEVTDLDTGKSDRLSSTELSELGLRVTITSCPGSALFTYSRVES